jgi:hypothetical protein
VPTVEPSASKHTTSPEGGPDFRRSRSDRADGRDLEGSARLLERLGPIRYGEALELYRRPLQEAFARQSGYEVDDEDAAFVVLYAHATPER